MAAAKGKKVAKEGVERLHRPLTSASNGLLLEFRRDETDALRMREIGCLLATQMLMFIMSKLLPHKWRSVMTRMKLETPKVRVPDRDHPVIVVSFARASVHLGDTMFEMLMRYGHQQCRHDILWAERKTDADGRVIGTDIDFSKVGKSVSGATIIFIDQMGATGGTMKKAIKEFRRRMPDAKIIVCHFIATLKALKVVSLIPGVHFVVQAIDPRITKKGYIEPGAGDVGDGTSKKGHLM